MPARKGWRFFNRGHHFHDFIVCEGRRSPMVNASPSILFHSIASFVVLTIEVGDYPAEREWILRRQNVILGFCSPTAKSLLNLSADYSRRTDQSDRRQRTRGLTDDGYIPT
uniref:Uncharacterized protein n=1 Tax=Opuntia streptacantha TaxID=393608 RepID=A0A7C8ZVH2_OPUST